MRNLLILKLKTLQSYCSPPKHFSSNYERRLEGLVDILSKTIKFQALEVGNWRFRKAKHAQFCNLAILKIHILQACGFDMGLKGEAPGHP